MLPQPPRAGLAALLEEQREALDRLEVLLPQALALLQHPIVVRALEEIAGVCVDGLPQSGEKGIALFALDPCERLLEERDVELERCVGPPLQRPGGDLEVAVGLGQRTSELVQHVAEIRPRLRLARVRPEQEGQALPRLRCLAVE